MQCLSSPTRSEIDKAHGQGVWLDIGVPSVRNLRRLSTTRIVLWYLLAISSIPLHFLYNSAVFSSLCTRQYNLSLVANEFIDGAPFNLLPFYTPLSVTNASQYYETTLHYETILQNYQKNQASLVKLDNKSCLETYTAPTISANSDLILVTTYSNVTNSVLSFSLSQESQLVIDSQNLDSCPLSLQPPCNYSGLLADPQNWLLDTYDSIQTANGVLTDLDDRIQYCLSKRVEEHCKLQFSLAIMIVVIICNLIKTTCMSIIAWKQDPEPLVTLGDAIASFLDRPDVTTEGNCIVGKTRFSRSWGLLLSRWHPQRLRWFRAASSKRWLVCNIL